MKRTSTLPTLTDDERRTRQQRQDYTEALRIGTEWGQVLRDCEAYRTANALRGTTRGGGFTDEFGMCGSWTVIRAGEEVTISWTVDSLNHERIYTHPDTGERITLVSVAFTINWPATYRSLTRATVAAALYQEATLLAAELQQMVDNARPYRTLTPVQVQS